MAGESGLETAAVGGALSYVPAATAADDVALSSTVERTADESLLLDRLYAEPWSFDFFQALHLLERLQPDRVAVGAFGDPRQEAVRLTTTTGVGFPASEIQALNGATTPPRLAVNFLGLTGPQGALPLAYSLYVAERVRAGDHALKEFLGIFDHRILSLFYRAWEKTHVGIAHGEEKRDWLTRHLLELVGLGNEALRDRLPMQDEALLFYAGLLGLPTRPASNCSPTSSACPCTSSNSSAPGIRSSARRNRSSAMTTARRRSWASARWLGTRSGTNNRARAFASGRSRESSTTNSCPAAARTSRCALSRDSIRTT